MEFFTVDLNLPFDPKYLLLFIPLMILNTVLMIVALISVLKDNLTQKRKILWAVVVLCVGTIGPLAYFAYSGISHKNDGGDDDYNE
ncbi:MAG: PLD nuclease N-terminal domain-containing protein [Ruminococcus sp.]|jgi:4-amino-4-deoxy-L-arabinose transferase-like glycosyltransferase|nr:PLD nuclease N-terminal domain-containing protein [Ruminococcus sp.]